MWMVCFHPCLLIGKICFAKDVGLQRLSVCWVVDRVRKKKLEKNVFSIKKIFWSLDLPLFVGRGVGLSVCVCRGFLTHLQLFDFDEIWVVGPVYDLVVPRRYWLLTPLWLPSNGTLKFLKNHKKIIFSKIKNRATTDCGQYIQPYCQKFPAGSYENCRRR